MSALHSSSLQSTRLICMHSAIVKQESAEPSIDFVCLSALKWLLWSCRLNISVEEEEEEEEGSTSTLNTAGTTAVVKYEGAVQS